MSLYLEQIRQLVSLQRVDDAIHGVRTELEQAPQKDGIGIYCSNMPHNILKFCLTWVPQESWVFILLGKIEKA